MARQMWVGMEERMIMDRWRDDGLINMNGWKDDELMNI